MKFRHDKFQVPNLISKDSFVDKAFRLLIYLLLISDDRGYCNPTYEDMMHGCECCRESIARSLVILKKKGWVEAIVSGGSRATTYQIHLSPRLLIGDDLQSHSTNDKSQL